MVAVARPAIMPHVSSSGGGDDLGSEDEVKVFKDEGEEEKRSSENLTEDKSDLIDLTESEVRRISLRERVIASPLPPSPPLPPTCSLDSYSSVLCVAISRSIPARIFSLASILSAIYAVKIE